MSRSLKCFLLLSLEEMAVRTVASLLCRNSDILTYTLNFLELGSLGKLKLQECARNKSWQLNLPIFLAEKVMDDLKNIGLEIGRWLKIHKSYFTFDVENYSSKIYWTAVGTIDYRKTAEGLVCCYEQNTDQLYKIACDFCLEEYIPLWTELSEETKKYYCDINEKLPELAFFWPYIMKGELSELDFLWVSSDRNLTSFNQWAFEHSVEKGNVIASEFFFRKLTPEERTASLLRTANSIPSSRADPFWLGEMRYDILLFLLRQMTPEQQMELVQARPVDILMCFLDSPRSDLFVENASLIWTFLPQTEYDNLRKKMENKFFFSRSLFPKMFEELLKQSTLDFKEYFFDIGLWRGFSHASQFLHLFFQFKNPKSIQVMWRSMEAKHKLNLLFEDYVLGVLYKSIIFGGFDLVEICLQELKLTKENRKRLKASLHKRNDLINMITCKLNWEKYWECFDKADASSDE